MEHKSRLATCPLFDGLEAGALALLDSRMRWMSLAQGEVLCHKGDESSGLYVVASGCLLVYDISDAGQEVTLSILGESAFLGELSVIDRQQRNASVKAQLPSVVGLLPQKDAAQLFYQNPEVARRMMLFLTGKVRSMTTERMLLSVPNTFARVCAWIDSEARPEADKATLLVTLPRQQDLASMLNTSRETVSRALARLVNDELIEKTRAGVRVLNPQALKRLVSRGS